MTPAFSPAHESPRVAFGPARPGFGSWEWVGLDMADELARYYDASTFAEEVPACDTAVFVKALPEPRLLRELARTTAVLFAPIDLYGSAAEIIADAEALRLCDRIIIHAERLRPYFEPYAPVEYVDHHLNFTSALREAFQPEGPLLWVGVTSNLPPLVEWVNAHDLPEELVVLTNLEGRQWWASADSLGFTARNRISVRKWSAEWQRELTARARAALDIKGSDFRARHKPPAKAIDFLASGVPLAMNRDSSSTEHLAGLGFELAPPDDAERWLSEAYWRETACFGRSLRQELTREKVGRRWRTIIDAALAERKGSNGLAISCARKVAEPAAPRPSPVRRTRVAILSLLFNWPSTGGGTVHTFETAKFLSRAGYDVRHLYARHADWRVGQVNQDELPYPAALIDFEPTAWNAATIQRRFREAVDEFRADWVIITDSWNFKPLLAQAVQGYRYFLRLAALECLCPLNNVRLLAESPTQLRQCTRHQLATPRECRGCVARREEQSGGLHRAERALAGFGHLEYDWLLQRAFAEAEAVLVVNPLIAEIVGPYAREVRVVPSGFDPERFPAPAADQATDVTQPAKLLFAGLTDELMKGFHVLRDACNQLWAERQDFELLVTSDPAAMPEPFARYIGWQSQDELPRRLRQSDLLVFPTVAQEALGRTAVEAMGSGIPVVASRIGGLPWTVVEGLTGLLCEPGDPADLAAKIARFLDDPELRARMGQAGRRRFEEVFQWPAILERHYQPLLGPAEVPDCEQAAESAEPIVLDFTRTEHQAVEEVHTLAVRDEARRITVSVRGPVDRAILCDLWDRDVYGVRSLPLASPAVVVDIGAHIGMFSILAAELWPDARIVACEADPENCRLLRRNLAGRPTVDLVEAAIVAQDVPEVEFNAVADKAAANSGGGSCRRPEPGSVMIRVPAVPIVRLWNEQGITDCDLLKLDCEGSELPLLRALAEAQLLPQIRHVVGEWHSADAQAVSVAQVRAELQELLSPTHLVEFAPHSGGREGHFTARSLQSPLVAHLEVA